MLFSPPSSPPAMHIPDGFLSVWVSASFWIISAIVLTIALRKTSHSLEERQVPLMGVLAAAIFAGQMLNFSVAGGTSGHLLGAALAVILLGPWPAVVVMTSVVSVQALLFQDGGILALGANIFNMAIIGVFISYTVFSVLARLIKKRPIGLLVSGFTAAWSSIFVAALACGLQLAISGTSPANIAIPAMAAIHALIGIGEGLITTGALTFLLATRSDLLKPEGQAKVSHKGILGVGSLIAVLLVFLSPFASSHPDGLEWVAEQNSFLQTAREAFYNIIPDYALPGISNSALATIIAGLVGIVVVFAIAYLTARAEKRSSAIERLRD